MYLAFFSIYDFFLYYIFLSKNLTLHQNIFHHMTMHIGKAEVSTLKAIS